MLVYLVQRKSRVLFGVMDMAFQGFDGSLTASSAENADGKRKKLLVDNSCDMTWHRNGNQISALKASTVKQRQQCFVDEMVIYLKPQLNVSSAALFPISPHISWPASPRPKPATKHSISRPWQHLTFASASPLAFSSSASSHHLRTLLLDRSGLRLSILPAETGLSFPFSPYAHSRLARPVRGRCWC